MKKGLVLIALSFILSFILLSCSTHPTKVVPLEPKLSGSSQVDHNRVILQTSEKLFTDLEKSAKDLPAADFLNRYNELMILLSNGSNSTQLFVGVHTDKNLRDELRKDQVKYSGLLNKIYMSQNLFDKFNSLSSEKLNSKQQFLVKKTVQAFRLKGVDKDTETRKKITALNKEITEISNQFYKNLADNKKVLKFTEAELKGLPKDFIESHRSKEDPKLIEVSTSRADSAPVMKYAHSPKVKKQLYLAVRNYSYPDNKPVLKNLLVKRAEYARLLGFKNYADYVTNDKMIGSAKNAKKFIKNMMGVTYKKAKSEYRDLLREKRKTYPRAKRVYDWERYYLLDRVLQSKFNIDFQEARKYFEYTKVRRGIFQLSENLFKIKIKKTTDVATWHPSVEAYDIFEGEKQIGRFFMDNFPRDGKYNHAAHFPIRLGVKGRQLPQSSLVMNMPDPKKSGGVALLEYGQVRTFLHEFGHLLHHIFAGNQEYIDQSGVSTEWDFVEAPSQMLEEWIVDTRTLQSFAVHYKTNKVIPTDMIKKLKAVDKYGAGIFVRRQLYLSDISLGLHMANPKTLNIDRYFTKSWEKYRLFSNIKGNRFPYTFGHLTGYSAIYYTYMWSLAISKDLFSSFKNNGLYDETVAKNYREKVLGKGGSKPAKDLVKDFLGREYSLNAFKEYLN